MPEAHRWKICRTCSAASGVGNDFEPVRRVFLVAVGGNGGNPHALFRLMLNNGVDLPAGLPGIPLVKQVGEHG